MTTATNVTPQDDSVLDAQIGILLRVGMLSAAAVILVGGVLFLLHHGRSIPDYRVFHGTPANLRSIGEITNGAIHGNDLSIIQFGILMLVATPVARVIFSVFAFAAERDYLYVTISGIVLLVLLYSLIWQ
jgi:uncharacterized membrane protein